MNTLAPAAQAVIDRYLRLPMLGEPVNAPYFNNQRVGVRGGLAVNIGKGSPEDIGLEAEIQAKLKHFPITTATTAEIKQFLVEQNLGVDCSALVFYVLKYEAWARNGHNFEGSLVFPQATTWWRRWLAKFRTIENTSVSVLGADANSRIVPTAEVAPGDLIFLWRTGLHHTLNHVLLVTAVSEHGLSYVHSFRWRTEGQYDHGVRTGTITWPNSPNLLLTAVWTEKNQTGQANDTFSHAQEAELVEIRRPRIFGWLNLVFGLE